MIRILDGKVRAFLSDRYRRIDNLELLEAVLPIIKEMKGAEIISSEVTPTNMYIKVINKKLKAMALAINKDNFEALVAGDQPVVIDFWAEWCGPCRTMSPIVDELAAEYEGKVVIGKCDVEENDDITMKYGVRNIPTIVFLKGGELVDKQVGACPKVP